VPERYNLQPTDYCCRKENVTQTDCILNFNSPNKACTMGCNASKSTEVAQNNTTEQPPEEEIPEKVATDSDEATPPAPVEVS